MVNPVGFFSSKRSLCWRALCIWGSSVMNSRMWRSLRYFCGPFCKPTPSSCLLFVSDIKEISTELLQECFWFVYILFAKSHACDRVDYVGAFTTNVFECVLFTPNTAFELIVLLNQKAEEAFFSLCMLCCSCLWSSWERWVNVGSQWVHRVSWLDFCASSASLLVKASVLVGFARKSWKSVLWISILAFVLG